MKECKFKPELISKKKYQSLESAYNPKNYEQKMEEYHSRKEVQVISCKLGQKGTRRTEF